MAAPSPGLSLKRLWVLMVTAFVDMIGFALLLPLVPLYAVASVPTRSRGHVDGVVRLRAAGVRRRCGVGCPTASAGGR